MCAGDAASRVIVAGADAGSQLTAPASSFSFFSEVAVHIDSGVKATISEGAGEGFIGHGEEPTQTTLSI